MLSYELFWFKHSGYMPICDYFYVTRRCQIVCYLVDIFTSITRPMVWFNISCLLPTTKLPTSHQVPQWLSNRYRINFKIIWSNWTWLKKSHYWLLHSYQVPPKGQYKLLISGSCQVPPKGQYKLLITGSCQVLSKGQYKFFISGSCQVPPKGQYKLLI